MGILAPIVFLGVAIVFANSPQVQAELVALTRNPALRLFAEPVDILTPGGYATWRLSLVLPLLAIWALLTASRTLRGEEERGGLDTLLSVPHARWRIATAKLAALVAALLAIGLLVAVLTFAGARAVGVELGAGRALLFGLNPALFAIDFGALALFVSQLTREARTAAGITGTILGLSFALTSAGRVIAGAEWIAQLSPLYYFELNKPLVAGYPVDWRAMIVMSALAFVLSGAAVAMFVRRDIGAPAVMPMAPFLERQPQAGLPLGAWSLRSMWAREVHTAVRSAVWWAVTVGCYTMLMTFLLRQLQRNLTDLVGDLAAMGPLYSELAARITRGGDVTVNLGLLNLVFSQLVVVVAAFAVTTVSRWTDNEEGGHLELALATPHPRWRAMLLHFGAAALALVAVATLVFAGVTIAADIVGMELDTSRVAQAAIGMVPVGLVVASAGYLFSGWLRARAVTGTLTALVIASFLITLLARLFGWPDALVQLSIFEHYGAPLVDGLRVPHVVLLLGVTGTMLVAATVRFTRKDIAH